MGNLGFLQPTYRSDVTPFITIIGGPPCIDCIVYTDPRWNRIQFKGHFFPSFQQEIGFQPGIYTFFYNSSPRDSMYGLFLGGGFKHVLFSPLPMEMIQF